MAVEKLQGYIDAVEELKRAYAKVREYGATIMDVARYINNWPYKMFISGVKTNFVITGDREYSLRAQDWPSAEQLAEVLSDYIKKRDKAQTLYYGLSDAQRDAMPPHPDI